ncbi:hypothetical protein CANCADRAFT_3617 [Tortispora caseinolytica NRRL Y-17796]|uniref:Matrin-type domain-containing protein n=1 Tax=Tortispora caseinolytica NRRL Y-17796 TaxID=767744 RepID=A0A1E4TB24_9ASCO|nr:hypothetical protein CANCADRAFT_3617 [Tortispora caseinolytica NRRL Y-17796]
METLRHAYEDIERLEQAIADRIRKPPRGRYAQKCVEHQIKRFLDEALLQAEFIVNNPIEEELKTITDFDREYKRLKLSYVTYPDRSIPDNTYSKLPWQTDNDPALVRFTDEEVFGKFLDLNVLFETYTSLKGASDVNYDTFVSSFDTLVRDLPDSGQSYFTFLTDLQSYLVDFIRRSEPLYDLDKFLAQTEADFQSQWVANTGKIDGIAPAAGSETMFCDACQKHFKTTTYDSHLRGKKHLRNAQAVSADSHNSDIKLGTPEYEKQRTLYCILKLAEYLRPVIKATVENNERKQAMTTRERQLEQQAIRTEYDDPSMFESKLEVDSDSDSDDLTKSHNPLKVPLGWDGKPIPLWLYKLQGLNMEFTCEICGNYLYRGRKAFEQHFTEQRHLNGLNVLGIQSPEAMKEITSIQEALDLWNIIKTNQRKERSKEENAVEMEDENGNVMSAKIYEDLKKQGIL